MTMPIIPQTPDQAAQRDQLALHAEPPPEHEVIAEKGSLTVRRHPSGFVLSRPGASLHLTASEIAWLSEATSE